jgi:hypothetical protein
MPAVQLHTVPKPNQCSAAAEVHYHLARPCASGGQSTLPARVAPWQHSMEAGSRRHTTPNTPTLRRAVGRAQARHAHTCFVGSCWLAAANPLKCSNSRCTAQDATLVAAPVATPRTIDNCRDLVLGPHAGSRGYATLVGVTRTHQRGRPSTRAAQQRAHCLPAPQPDTHMPCGQLPSRAMNEQTSETKAQSCREATLVQALTQPTAC